MPLTSIVPKEYLKARESGATTEALREWVRGFCLLAMRTDASKKGTPEPDSVSEELVTLTHDMYEDALKKSGEEE